MRPFLLTALLVLQGTLVVRGQSNAVRSDEVRIRRAVHQQLDRQFSAAAARTEIHVDELSAALPAGQPVRVEFSEAWKVPRGRTRAAIFTRRGERSWEEAGWALLRIAHYDSVVVTRRRLRRGQALTPDDIETAWAEVTRFRDQPLSPAHYRRLRAKERCYTRQYIRQGEIIRRRSVRGPYAAQAGEMLTMTYEHNGIAARLRCKARQSGFTGDVVRLACPSTGSLYRARLTEKGTAMWVETL